MGNRNRTILIISPTGCAGVYIISPYIFWIINEELKAEFKHNVWLPFTGFLKVYRGLVVALSASCALIPTLFWVQYHKSTHKQFPQIGS